MNNKSNHKCPRCQVSVEIKTQDWQIVCVSGQERKFDFKLVGLSGNHPVYESKCSICDRSFGIKHASEIQITPFIRFDKPAPGEGDKFTYMFKEMHDPRNELKGVVLQRSFVSETGHVMSTVRFDDGEICDIPAKNIILDAA